MWSLLLLTFACSRALAALSCEAYVPADIGWSFNLASGYLSANAAVKALNSVILLKLTFKDTEPNGSELQLDQQSPFGVDGYSYATDGIFALFNCTDKDLGVESRATYQCYPASAKGQHTNTTTRTDFIQIQSNNNLCLTVLHPHQDRSELNYTTCDTKPQDLRQLFKAVRTVTYPQGTCGGDPPTEDLFAVGVAWEEQPYCGKTSHWHLQNDTDVHSVILLEKNQAKDERFVFFDEAG